MIGQLTALDLPARLKIFAPAPVVQIAVGVLLASAAFAVRLGVNVISPQAAPFSLMFPTILIATGLAGWPAGVAALLASAALAWRFLLPSHLSSTFEPSAAVTLGLYLVGGGLVIAAAAAYRGTVLALRESQERLDLATSAAHVGVWELRIDAEEMFYSDEAKRICGFPLGRPVTPRMLETAIHPDDRPLARAHAMRACDPEIREESPYEHRLVRPNGEVRWVFVRGRAVFGPGPDRRLRAIRYLGTVQDVTARKADEERLRLLAREVDHRANNLLAVIQGTVALSQAETPRALKAVITGRINALARAHQLLAQARWEGADLRRLVEEELLAFSFGDEARVTIRGPSVKLPPAAAQSVAMALHELATNAAKYGALSAPCGRVEVSWRRSAARALHLRWRESGGPPVYPPVRKGLGMSLLDRALSGPLGGETRLEWRAEGLICELVLPAQVQEPGRPACREPSPETFAEPRAESVR